MTTQDSDDLVVIHGVVDTHCHLGPVGLPEDGAVDSATLVQEAATAGLSILVDVGIDLASSQRARSHADRHGMVRATVGLHPCSSDRFEAEWPELEQLARTSQPIAIGETGFDFHWQPEARAPQERSFRAHLDLARELDLAVIVHARNAFDATFSVLEDARDLRVIWHCFGGGPEEARKATDLGCYLSFAGPLTYKKADALREAARAAPADRLLVETDAPFLPPQSARGKRNQPAYVIETLTRLADVRGWSLQEAADRTRDNAVTAFGPHLLPH